MKFTKEDIGKKVKILNCGGAAWILVGENYTINTINKTGSGVIFTDKNGLDLMMWIGQREHVLFLNETIINLGDEVIILKETTSFKVNERVIVTGYVHEDKTKLLIDRCLPGGWLDISNVMKVLDLTKLRFKTPWELARDSGIMCFTSLLIRDQILNFFDKSLSSIDVQQDVLGLYIMIKDKRFSVTKNMYTSEPKEELRLVLASKSILVNFFSPTTDKGKKIIGYAHNLIKMHENDKGDDPNIMYDLLYQFAKNGEITPVNIPFRTTVDIVQIVPVKDVIRENEEKSKEKNDIIKEEGPIIPF